MDLTVIQFDLCAQVEVETLVNTTEDAASELSNWETLILHSFDSTVRSANGEIPDDENARNQILENMAAERDEKARREDDRMLERFHTILNHAFLEMLNTPAGDREVNADDQD